MSLVPWFVVFLLLRVAVRSQADLPDEVLAPEVDALGKMQIDYVAALGKIAVALPPPPPKGAGEVENLLKRVADSVAFGKTSVKDGSQQFHDETVAILARA